VVAGFKPVSVTTLAYVRDVGYVTELVEHCLDVKASLEVPYSTQGWAIF
jgi:hypothetical protein